MVAPRPAAGAAGAVPAGAWDAAADLAGRKSRQPHVGAKVRKTLRSMSRAGGIEALHDSLVDEWHGEAAPVDAQADAVDLAPAHLDVASDTMRMMLGLSWASAAAPRAQSASSPSEA